MSELHQALYLTAARLLLYTLIGLCVKAILAGEFNRRGMGQRILVASLDDYYGRSHLHVARQRHRTA